MMRRLLRPLTPLYAAAVAAKNAAYDRRWLKTQALRGPVISVGNISVGGSGKTPFVIALAKLLQRQGMGVNVLSRGYGRSSNSVEQVDPAGSAEHFGDEPLLIAQSAGVPVYVGASRYAAGLLAERNRAEVRIHLLDDGFQHRKLLRTVDIVLIHRSDFEEMLLPSGRLREPLSSLHRASVLVLREEDSDLESRLKQHCVDRPIWWVRRSIVILHNLGIPENLGKAVVFCGIARPDEFLAMLKRHNVEIAASHPFRDHHPYSEKDMQLLIREASAVSAGAFLTTEKDFVRLSPKQKEMLASVAALRVAKLEVRLRDEAAVVRHLETLLPANSFRSL